MARTPTKDLFPNLAIGAMALVVKPDLADFFRKVGHAPTHSLNFKAPFFLKTAVIHTRCACDCNYHLNPTELAELIVFIVSNQCIRIYGQRRSREKNDGCPGPWLGNTQVSWTGTEVDRLLCNLKF